MRLILIITITLFAFVNLMPVYSYSQVSTPTDTSALALPHNHEGMKRCKRHNYYKDRLNSNKYSDRLNTIQELLYQSKGGYIMTDTALDKDLGLMIMLDFSRDSVLTAFRKMVYFPDIKPRDTVERRERNKYLETVWSVSQYIFNNILFEKNPYRFIAFYMKSPWANKVFFALASQVDDVIQVRYYHWKKQSSKL